MRPLVHHRIYAILLCLLAASMTTSVFATNLVWVLLLANWVAEWNWKEKFSGFGHNHLLQAFLALAAIHLLWLVGTSNMAYALNDIQKKLPLFAIPLVILTSRPLTTKERLNVGIAYIGAIFVVSIIGLVRYLTLPDLPYREIVPYISHIRFGLNICMAMAILAYTAYKHRHAWLYCLSFAMALWFCYFLFLLHAYTAFIILFVTVWVMLITFRKEIAEPLRIPALGLVALCSCIVIGWVGYYIHAYYHLQPLSTQPLEVRTVNGNEYQHLDDNLIENGNYVHRYICEKELRQEWSKVSPLPIDTLTEVGYTIYPALVRYLNGMGVTKDSIGMTHLTSTDIRAIEKGIANPVYIQHGPRKMVYVLCYEYENYRCYRNVSNFSMLQRLELWNNGWHIFLQHPLWGVGTGDVVDECHQRFEETHSPLAGTNLHTHNQYLNFLLAFGLVGFLAILFFFIRPFRHHHRSPLLVTFLCILLVSFLSEDTLETLAGITFAAFGLAFLYSHFNDSDSKTCTDTTH